MIPELADALEGARRRSLIPGITRIHSPASGCLTLELRDGSTVRLYTAPKEGALDDVLIECPACKNPHGCEPATSAQSVGVVCQECGHRLTYYTEIRVVSVENEDDLEKVRRWMAAEIDRAADYSSPYRDWIFGDRDAVSAKGLVDAASDEFDRQDWCGDHAVSAIADEIVDARAELAELAGAYCLQPGDDLGSVLRTEKEAERWRFLRRAAGMTEHPNN